MAPTKEINIQLKPANQVVEVVKHLTYDSTYKSDDVVLINLACMPKARLEIASISSIIQYSCDIVLSGIVHDVVFDFSRVRMPFTWPKKSIREILHSNASSPIAIELVSRDCRLIVFKKNDHNRRDDYYDQIKNWRKDLPNRFHLMLNELVENVSAHAKLEDDRFCFTVGHLEIISGTQVYEQRGIAEWKGTMVHGEINLTNEFNYRHAMKLFKEPTLLKNDRFLVCHVHLNVYGQRTLRTRELCEEIIRDLELAAERSPKIILDFFEVDEISQAFRGFLKQFVVKNSKIQILIMVPPSADEELKEDLQELIELAARNNP
ncbi:13033_t:CDS:2, partial [Dentiscutata erythropus]